jgi:hypothetical protein
MNLKHRLEILFVRKKSMSAWERQAFRKSFWTARLLRQGQQDVAGAEPEGKRAQSQPEPEIRTIKNAIIFAVKHCCCFLSTAITFSSAI